MSVESISLVLNHSRATGVAKLVMIGIANHDGDGGAWPSQATLARYANCTDRTVRSALLELVALGELIVHSRKGGSRKTDPRHRPNLYELTLSTTPVCDRKQFSARDDSRPEMEGGYDRKQFSTEPSLEPSTITTSTDLTSPPPESGFISLDAYFQAHPDEAPRVTRWAKGLTNHTEQSRVDL